ncbi:MAG: hypothetical protein U9R36_02875 [Elusimicrobiota bacterium]|nr:hypothetical protein [Elusimicrobiota bacterium]
MVKKFFIFCFAAGAVIYFTCSFIDRGGCRDFIAENADKNWAPAAMYYLGNYFVIIQQPDRAEEIYKEVLEIFPSSKYYEPSLYRYFRLEDKHGVKREAIKRGKAYLEEFSDTSNAELVRKRLDILKKF